jgi:E3 ubiquitin-protein ligase UBR7
VPDKDALNAGNNYGGRSKHNFFGFFCTCDQFFGNEQEEREMCQCLVCEDWYHDSCIPQVHLSL